MLLTDAMWPLAIAAFVIAGSVKGMVGIGMPVAAVSILAQVADPRLAIALMLIPGFVVNIWQIHRSREFVETLKLIWPFALTMMLGIGYFSIFAASLPVNTLLIGVGCVVVVFVLTNLVRPSRIPERFDLAAQIGIGSLAGAMGGLSGIWSPAVVIYLLSRQLSRDQYLAATGVLILLGSMVLIIGYWRGGLLSMALLGQGAIMTVPTLIGFAIGEYLRKKLGSTQFRNAVLLVFFVMGLNLLRRGLF